MRIIFYTNNSDSNELNKNINLVTELQCNVNKDNLDVLSPILFLSYFNIKEQEMLIFFQRHINITFLILIIKNIEIVIKLSYIVMIECRRF